MRTDKPGNETFSIIESSCPERRKTRCALLASLVFLWTLAVPAVQQDNATSHTAASDHEATATRVLRFPADYALGKLVNLDKPRHDPFEYTPEWSFASVESRGEFIAEAIGDVTVPANARVGLTAVLRYPKDDLAGLVQLGRNDIHALDFDNESPKPSDKCLESISHLTGLKALALNASKISNEGLRHLEKLTSLEELRAPEDLNSTGSSNIARARSLKRLTFSATTATVECLSHLSRLKSLEELYLYTRGIEWEGMSHLATLPAFRSLYIGMHECHGPGLRRLAELPNLRELAFYDLNGAGVADLPHMPNLKELRIQYKGNAFTPEQLANLSGFSGLENLSITGRYTDESLAHLKSLRKLKSIGLHVNFQDSFSLSDTTISHLKDLRELETVDFYEGEYTDEGLRILSQLPRLKKLRLPNSTSFTNAGLVHVGNMQGLEEIKLRGQNFTDEGLKPLANLKSLRSLEMLFRSKLTTEALTALSPELPNLERMEVDRYKWKGDGSGWTDSRHVSTSDLISRAQQGRYLSAVEKFVEGQRVILRLHLQQREWTLKETDLSSYFIRINGKDFPARVKWPVFGEFLTTNIDLAAYAGQTSEGQLSMTPGEYYVVLIVKNAEVTSARDSNRSVVVPELRSQPVEFMVVPASSPEAADIRAGDKYNGMTVNEWINELASLDTEVRKNGIENLSQMGKPAAAPLLKLITSRDPRTTDAMNAIIGMGDAARELLPELLNLASEKERSPGFYSPEEQTAVRALSEMTWAADQILPVLKQTSENPNAGDRKRREAGEAVKRMENLAKKSS